MNSHPEMILTAAGLTTESSAIFNRLRAKQGQKLTVTDVLQIQEWMRSIEGHLFDLRKHLRGSTDVDSAAERVSTLVQHNQPTGAGNG